MTHICHDHQGFLTEHCCLKVYIHVYIAKFLDCKCMHVTCARDVHGRVFISINIVVLTLRASKPCKIVETMMY